MNASPLHHRTGTTNVTVVDGTGTPVAHTDVAIEQTRHAFGFGNIAFDLIGWINHEKTEHESVFGGAPLAQGPHLAAKWLELFNHATLPFYWRTFEPERGKPQTDRLMATAAWLRENGVTIKGHPLVWHTLAPQWLLDVPLDEREGVIRDRIARDVTAFAGVVDLWDAINEAVIMPVFTAEDNAITPLAQAKGQIETIRMAFDSAREANPNARLVLNDFDLSHDYENLIEECLAAGIQIDALGLQTHMHQGFRGEDNVNDILERFSRFGLPIQMTETSLVSGELMPAHIVDLNDYVVDSWPSTPDGEQRQAEEIVRHYSTVLAHPLVESLTYWGLTDAGAWLGAPIGLLREDGSPKPSFDALHGLIKGDWWHTPTPVRTDDAGRVSLTGWGGDYRVTVGNTSADVVVTPGREESVTLTLA